MLIIKVNKENSIPVFKQICEELKKLIEKGILKPGDKLPSSRLLAKDLGINRTTVYRAYEELWSFGYIESRPGSYSIVRKRAKLKVQENEVEGLTLDWEKNAKPEIIKLLNQTNNFIDVNIKDDLINFLPLSPDPDHMPVEQFKKYINIAINKNGASLLSYNNTLGYNPLREFISHRLAYHGIHTSIDNILITNGTQNALELILKYIDLSGKKIILESPTYSVAIPLFKMYGADIVEIPITRNGIDLKRVEEVFRKNNVAFLFTMANFQNPTGITSTQAHREKLLQLCNTHKVPIIEDGFEEEMKYYGKAILPIKSMYNSDLVIYLGTFSKTLFPGLRLGWLVANKRLVASLNRLKQISEISGNFLIQAAVYEYCQSGNYDLHVKRLHRIYRKRMAVALKSAEKYLPKNKCKFSKPSGGYNFWVSLINCEMNENQVIELIQQNGVAVAPGNIFYAAKKQEVAFRLSIAHLDENLIEEGIRKLSIAFKRLK